ncbi:tubulin polyglutamylase TTLL4 [Pungitius pungitius]|uniref:tubulin polyglutamylase TTLL4 n=1 Tax=Pungitius pungitius TaxID=134920 RepID=UPI002E0F15E9
MPTNQSSPWDGAELRPRSDAGSPTRATSVSARATKVPFRPTPAREDRAKPLSSHVATPAPPPRQACASVAENGYRTKTTAQSQSTTVPEGSPHLPRTPNGFLGPHQGPKQAGGGPAEPRAPPSVTEGDGPLNVQPAGAVQKPVSLQASPPGGNAATGRSSAPTGDALTLNLGLELISSICYRDLFVKRQPSPQQTDCSTPEAADRSSSSSSSSSCSTPSVPPLCLTLSEHLWAPLRSDTQDTVRETMSVKAAAAAACSRAQSTRTRMSASTAQLEVRGRPPAALASAASSKPRTLDPKQQAPGSSSSSSSSSSTSTTFGRIALPEDAPPPTVPSTKVTAVAPAGALVGSVTSQISAIQLIASSPPPPPSSPSPMEARLVEESQPSGSDTVMQVEEGLPDELENACSDDDDSDSCSINGSSSTASITACSGVEGPMSPAGEDEREERPALVPSLFPFVAPTLYFSTADEKVELLPAEQRRLLKWKISTVTPNIVKHTVGRSHFKVTKKSHDWLGCWGHHMKSPCFKALAEHQKLNHFPGTFQIGRKDRLWRNLSKMQVHFGKQEFSFFPRTFVLPQDTKLLRKAWEDGGSRQKWIIKPPASARGIGIQVIHKWSQMPRKRPLLVQKYLHKPYLISGNKFDLRIYVYVSCYDPLRIYIFSDGLVRFASCKYSSSMKTLGNKFMHLTNYSVNKKNSEYQSNSDDKACQGHKWALKALWQYLGSKGVNTTRIWEKIKDIVIKTIIGSEPYVNNLLKSNVRTPYSCHELFGFDIMLDEKLKPWILEVNISPSLHSNTALDVAVKGQMIRDLLNLAGFRIPQKEDVVAPCSSTSSSTSSLCVGTRERTKPEQSADEKVKRAFYLAQRYADQDFLSTVLDVLTPEDVRVLAASEDERTRVGQFERIFPSPASSRYLRFFECPRYLNILLDQWEQKYWSSRSKGISLLTSLCEKGVHLGTSDPLHMWSKSSYISRFDPHKQDLLGPSTSRVVVTHQHRSQAEDGDGDGSDAEAASISSTFSPSPGSSVSSSVCASPQPGRARRRLPRQSASL